MVRKFVWKDEYIILTETLLELEDMLEAVLLSTPNKMQRYTIFFIIVYALHVSGGFSARHQELKNCTHSVRYVYSS